MRKLSALLIVLLCAPLAAAPQIGFGKVKNPISSNSGGDADSLIQQIDDVVADFGAASDRLLDAYLKSIAIYISEEKKKELEQRIAQIKAIEKPNEKAKETAEMIIEMNKI